MIAEVIPAPIPIDRKEAFKLCRLGRPKEMLDAPQVVLTPNSSLSLRINWNAVIPARFIAPTGIIKGSTTTSLALIPKSWARSTIFFATLNRSSGSSDIPVSSFEIATTAASYFFIKGRTASSLSSSPVTELTSALP